MVMASLRTMLSNKSSEWSTPEGLYQELDAEFHFNFDPCPLGGDIDGRARLTNSWAGKRVFCNPPYGPQIRAFLNCWQDAELAVYLLPARVDTRWFHEVCLPHASEIRFIKGRLKFGGGENPAPFPSMVIIFGGPHRMTDSEMAILGEQDQCKELALMSAENE
jgi:hypothetical protein